MMKKSKNLKKKYKIVENKKKMIKSKIKNKKNTKPIKKKIAWQLPFLLFTYVQFCLLM